MRSMTTQVERDYVLGTHDDEVQRLIDDSVTAARSAPDPMPEDLLTDVYIKY